MEARTHLPATLTSPHWARRFVEAYLRAWGCDDLVEPITLLTSELVTNAVVHAGTPLAVTVRHTPGAVRVEVADDSQARPSPRDAADDADSGRGLRLVDTVADGWGVDVGPTGKAVWAEVRESARWARPTPVDGGWAPGLSA